MSIISAVLGMAGGRGGAIQYTDYASHGLWACDAVTFVCGGKRGGGVKGWTVTSSNFLIHLTGHNERDKHIGID